MISGDMINRLPDDIRISIWIDHFQKDYERARKEHGKWWERTLENSVFLKHFPDPFDKTMFLKYLWNPEVVPLLLPQIQYDIQCSKLKRKYQDRVAELTREYEEAEGNECLQGYIESELFDMEVDWYDSHLCLQNLPYLYWLEELCLSTLL